jgi:flagellar biosynthesis protein FlhF
MYVRKFEADTIEEALKDIKRELGPEAVILKTITNKGLKGAFKKKKIEITAAISEKSYTRKASVDTVLNDNQKEEFYNGSASYIANMIDQHDLAKEKHSTMNNNNQTSHKSSNGYGSAGLNRTVSTTKGIASQIKEGLDDFLSLGEKEERGGRAHHPREFNFDDEIESGRSMQQQAPIRQQAPIARTNPQPQQQQQVHNQAAQAVKAAPATKIIGEEMFEKQKNKIDDLEKKLYELTKSFERIHKKEPIGIYQLRTTLKSLDINEIYIQQLIKKGLFELTDSDVENSDVVFEFALREMMNTVSVAMPLFSNADAKKSPVITVFLSESSCGQTSMVQKVGSLKADSVIIRNSNTINPKVESKSFAEKIFGMTVVKTQSIAEIVSECRKSLESGKSVFIDYKCNEAESNETKKFIDGLRRAFSKVEVLITLSAIHTELYNRKVLGSYRSLSDGVVVSHLDACLNFGALFNITQDIKDLPYKFFGTGEVLPDDLEPATAERLLAGIFKFS